MLRQPGSLRCHQPSIRADPSAVAPAENQSGHGVLSPSFLQRRWNFRTAPSPRGRLENRPSFSLELSFCSVAPEPPGEPPVLLSARLCVQYR